MTIEEIKRLDETEDHVEFKQAATQFNYDNGRKSVLGYVVALANERGGKLILGVREIKGGVHVITGSTAWQGQEGKLVQDIYRDLHIRVKTEELFEENRRVLVLHIPSRPIGKPLKFQDVPLMRVGEDLLLMSDEHLFSILQEQEPDFSARVCEGLALDDLHPEAIAKMKEAYSRKQQNMSFQQQGDRQVLSDLRLLHGEKLNYAALILLGKKAAINKYLPHAKIIWEFRFTESQVPYDFREEIYEPLFIGINQIWNLVNDKNGNIPIQSGAHIYNVNAFNEAVIREAILNAVAHRDYTISSDVVMKQFPRRIIIHNPGGFPKGVTKENIMVVSSTPRSRLMTEVLEKTGLVERSGQGVDKIFSITLSEGKPAPSYDDSDAYQVTLDLKSAVVDNAFSIYIGQIQSSRAAEQKLGAHDIITLDKIKEGKFQQLNQECTERLQRQNIITRVSGQSSRYRLGDHYYSLAQKEQEISNRYIVAELHQFLMVIQSRLLSIGDLERLLAGSLNRNQIKYLISKLYKDHVITSEGTGRGTKYKLTSDFRHLAGDKLISDVVSSLRNLYPDT